MNYRIAKILSIAALTLFCSTGFHGQTQSDDSLKIAAIEMLITAPPERSLPIIKKVLAGNYTLDIKEKALFVLSQTGAPEALPTLLGIASDADDALQIEAIRLIGISGNDDSLSDLKNIYSSGDASVRGAVLEALMIAGDSKSVLEIAESAEGRDFEEAVEMLGVMGANEQLRGLMGRPGAMQTLIEAYAISGDLETLRELAMDDSDQLIQVRSIEALGIIGGDSVDQTLIEIYQDAGNRTIRDAALHGLMVAGNDDSVLKLYRDSDSAEEKKRLLEILFVMDSDAVWDIVDTTLEGGS